PAVLGAIVIREELFDRGSISETAIKLRSSHRPERQRNRHENARTKMDRNTVGAIRIPVSNPGSRGNLCIPVALWSGWSKARLQSEPQGGRLGPCLGAIGTVAADPDPACLGLGFRHRRVDERGPVLSASVGLLINRLLGSPGALPGESVWSGPRGRRL